MGHRIGIAVLAATAVIASSIASSISAAQAKEVRYPAAHPEISLNVPDDWSVAETPLGLELQSPQKDSLVLAGFVGADRKSTDGWAKRALDRMASAGVVFAKPGQATTATAAKTAAKSNPEKPDVDKPKPAEAPKINTQKPVAQAPITSATAEVARANGDRPYSFGGPPSIQPPKIMSEGEENHPIAGRVGDVDLPTISDLAPNDGPMKPAKDFVYSGGVLRGEPVDVELSVFPFGKSKRLLMEQQSGATDARGFNIVRSLRNLTP